MATNADVEAAWSSAGNTAGGSSWRASCKDDCKNMDSAAGESVGTEGGGEAQRRPGSPLDVPGWIFAQSNATPVAKAWASTNSVLPPAQTVKQLAMLATWTSSACQPSRQPGRESAMAWAHAIAYCTAPLQHRSAPPLHVHVSLCPGLNGCTRHGPKQLHSCTGPNTLLYRSCASAAAATNAARIRTHLQQHHAPHEARAARYHVRHSRPGLAHRSERRAKRTSAVRCPGGSHARTACLCTVTLQG